MIRLRQFRRQLSATRRQIQLIRRAGPSRLIYLVALVAGGLVIPLSFAALFAEHGSGPVRAGMRILGSWVAAIGLMLSALSLHR
jgi:hypothetical protein